MDRITTLPMDVEDSIKKFIDQKFAEDNLCAMFPNPLLREDILDLLDRYCTVVYFPLDHEENNGFRLKEVPFSNGQRQDFVFINTAQTMEKQVFTAAHELGHIWNVDSFVIDDLSLPDTVTQRELIINRFAAVLLIPRANFIVSVRAGLKEYGNHDNKTISYVNLLKMIVGLMNQFFAPIKAVTLRLVELNVFDKSVAETLLGKKTISKEEITNLTNKYILEFGYLKLLKPSNKRWIEGLSEKLDIAEKSNLISINKINLMREKFELKAATSTAPEMRDVVSLNTQEGFET